MNEGHGYRRPMRLLCLGMSHKTASVDTRERLAFDADRQGSALSDLRARWPEGEFAIVATCNRTEIYVARPNHAHPRSEELRGWLAEQSGMHAWELAELTYTLQDAEAIRHLFAVAGGLESMVVGENQIVGQIKAAHARAVEFQAAGPALKDLFQRALHTAKHIRTETDISAGKVSIASVAVDCIRQHPDAVTGGTVLIVGAGKTVELMLETLATLGAGRVLVVNRSPEKARQLADRFDGEAMGLDALGPALSQADIVLCSTGSPDQVISAEMVRGARADRPDDRLVIVDIAVPRDVDPAVREIDGVCLHNIDDLQPVIDRTLSGRLDFDGKIDALLDEHVAEMAGWLELRRVAPTIDALHRQLTALAEAELQQARNKLSSHDDAAEDAEIIRQCLHRTIRQILHPLTDYLKSRANDEDANERVAAVRELFQLDNQD